MSLPPQLPTKLPARSIDLANLRPTFIVLEPPKGYVGTGLAYNARNTVTDYLAKFTESCQQFQDFLEPGLRNLACVRWVSRLDYFFEKTDRRRCRYPTLPWIECRGVDMCLLYTQCIRGLMFEFPVKRICVDSQLELQA